MIGNTRLYGRAPLLKTAVHSVLPSPAHPRPLYPFVRWLMHAQNSSSVSGDASLFYFLIPSRPSIALLSGISDSPRATSMSRQVGVNVNIIYTSILLLPGEVKHRWVSSDHDHSFVVRCYTQASLRWGTWILRARGPRTARCRRPSTFRSRTPPPARRDIQGYK